MSQRNEQEWIAVGDRTNSPSYAPARMMLDHGKGVMLYDTQGREYLDFVAGIAVNCLGYAHPRIVEVIKRQSERLLHVSNMFFTQEQIALMEALTDRSFADRVFLCNSGAEANESAIKLARRYQYEVRGEKNRVEIVTMHKSFHGRTYGALTATAQPKYHKGFGPMLPGFQHATFNDLKDVQSKVGPKTAAVMLEPVQGEGGVKPSTQDFLDGVRALCDEQGVLLIFDEVQAGMGRTGHMFAYQGYGVEPDIMTLAKALGGGVPIGAMLAREETFGGWTRGSHATTFGGNPFVSAVAREVISVMEEERLPERAQCLGAKLQKGLVALSERYDVIKDVRGRGLMVGVEVGEAAGALVTSCREQGLLINSAGGHTLRLVPPLIVEEVHVDRALACMERAFEQWSLTRAA